MVTHVSNHSVIGISATGCGPAIRSVGQTLSASKQRAHDLKGTRVWQYSNHKCEGKIFNFLSSTNLKGKGLEHTISKKDVGVEAEDKKSEERH